MHKSIMLTSRADTQRRKAKKSNLIIKENQQSAMINKREEEDRIHKATNKTTKVSTHISIIVSNMSEFNSPRKYHRLAEWMKEKHNPTYTAYKKLSSPARTHTDKVKRWKKIFHTNKKQEAGVAIIISNKIRLYIKKQTKRYHYIMIQESTQQEDVTIVNIYISNTGALRYTN